VTAPDASLPVRTPAASTQGQRGFRSRFWTKAHSRTTMTGPVAMSVGAAPPSFAGTSLCPCRRVSWLRIRGGSGQAAQHRVLRGIEEGGQPGRESTVRRRRAPTQLKRAGVRFGIPARARTASARGRKPESICIKWSRMMEITRQARCSSLTAGLARPRLIGSTTGSAAHLRDRHASALGRLSHVTGQPSVTALTERRDGHAYVE